MKLQSKKFPKMEEHELNWAIEKAYTFYDDLDDLDISNAADAVLNLIKTHELTFDDVNALLENMIDIFSSLEEYEKCH